MESCNGATIVPAVQFTAAVWQVCNNDAACIASVDQNMRHLQTRAAPATRTALSNDLRLVYPAADKGAEIIAAIKSSGSATTMLSGIDGC
jgi:hypothetical protein